jgi:hypothetical protein
MKVDMSPAAITRRLRRASELRDLCLSLGKAKPVRGGQHATRQRIADFPKLNRRGKM